MTHPFSLTITAAEAAPIVKQAHAAKQLAAQAALPGAKYITTTGERCAIGCLYTPEQASALEYETASYETVRGLVAAGTLVVPEHEADWFARLQQRHDTWTGDSNDKYREADFLSHLDKLP